MHFVQSRILRPRCRVSDSTRVDFLKVLLSVLDSRPCVKFLSLMSRGTAATKTVEIKVFPNWKTKQKVKFGGGPGGADLLKKYEVCQILPGTV